VHAVNRPVVVLTSNRTRELHDALKRRCLYYWIEYPSFQKELDIVRAKVPQASAALARQVTAFIQELREVELYKIPGVAETLDWTTALLALDRQALSEEIIEETLGVILKYQDDVAFVRGENVRQILNRARNRDDS
jgi:MoxR-like ATPase